jgi:hypothetical protein
MGNTAPGDRRIQDMPQVQDAITRAKVRQEKQFKDRDEKAKKLAETVRADMAKGDQKSPSTPTLPVKAEAKPGDQKSVIPAPQPKAGDQKSVTEPKPKKAKKISPTFLKFKKLPNQPLEAKIHIIATGNPKRRDAARRYTFYKEGMTVADYLKVTKENNITNALANADIRWDYAAGFIMVLEK